MTGIRWKFRCKILVELEWWVLGFVPERRGLHSLHDGSESSIHLVSSPTLNRRLVVISILTSYTYSSQAHLPTQSPSTRIQHKPIGFLAIMSDARMRRVQKEIRGELATESHLARTNTSIKGR